MSTGDKDAYYAEIGQRLRRARLDRGMSLQAVEDKSGFKAVVVGSHERCGTISGRPGAAPDPRGRAPSVFRLMQLARFYGVPLSDLIPGCEPESPAGFAEVLEAADGAEAALAALRAVIVRYGAAQGREDTP